MKYDVTFLKKDIENEVKTALEDYSMDFATTKDIEDLIEQLEDIKDFIDEQITKLAESISGVRPTKHTETEKYKELTTHEAVTVALAQRPNAPERVRMEAEAIIKKYGLTPEDVQRIYEFVFGYAPYREIVG